MSVCKQEDAELGEERCVCVCVRTILLYYIFYAKKAFERLFGVSEVNLFNPCLTKITAGSVLTLEGIPSSREKREKKDIKNDWPSSFLFIHPHQKKKKIGDRWQAQLGCYTFPSVLPPIALHHMPKKYALCALSCNAYLANAFLSQNTVLFISTQVVPRYASSNLTLRDVLMALATPLISSLSLLTNCRSCCHISSLHLTLLHLLHQFKAGSQKCTRSLIIVSCVSVILMAAEQCIHDVMEGGVASAHAHSSPLSEGICCLLYSVTSPKRRYLRGEKSKGILRPSAQPEWRRRRRRRTRRRRRIVVGGSFLSLTDRHIHPTAPPLPSPPTALTHLFNQGGRT